MICKHCDEVIESSIIANNNGYFYHLSCSSKTTNFIEGTQIILKPDEEGTPPPNKALKNDTSKPDLSLIPYSALEYEAKAMMIGAKKYGRYNYTKGHEASQLVAAAQRHLLAWFNGEELDPEDGQHHLGSVRACMGMLIEQIKLGTLKDNRRGK